MELQFGKGKIQINWQAGKIVSLLYNGVQMLTGSQNPLFSMRLRDTDGNTTILDSDKADVQELPDGALYRFGEDSSIRISVQERNGQLVWKAYWDGYDSRVPEFLDFPALTLSGKLRANGGNGAVLWSYNEGGIVEDAARKPAMTDPEYPSMGSYSMFPYMLCAQFTAYLFGDSGLYMGVHDPLRAPKGLDFACGDNETQFRTRLFLGGVNESPEIVWTFFHGDWMDAADIYKHWFESSLPSGLKKVCENTALPEWYREMPIVITYPVRGIHDMDRMDPNKFFPYINALPVIEEYARKMNSRILVLLMHWEGTAPWAPPVVWPPFGGEEQLHRFMDELHRQGHLLGVYCSGLGWTIQSNLIQEYNTRERFEAENLKDAMCLAPDGSLPYSRICTGQRSGYDICPASKKGQMLLKEALEPLFSGGLDYIQAMDQNHGGSMYFCYSADHGHPRVPGVWMTRTMQDTLKQWKQSCPEALLGCESAAAEPYLEWLGLSDNRYELNFSYGRAVPLYTWLFHPYVHNFMGNQVCAPFAYTTEGICYRLAYSFAAGDMLTLVLNDEGEVMFHWGMRDFSHHSDKSRIQSFCEKLHRCQLKYRNCFSDGAMIRPQVWTCTQTAVELSEGLEPLPEPSVLSCAWETPDNHRVQFFVNYTDTSVPVAMNDKSFIVPALSVVSFDPETGTLTQE